MKKKVKQSITIFIPISQLVATWEGNLDKLPANQVFNLVINYPFGGTRKHEFPQSRLASTVWGWWACWAKLDKPMRRSMKTLTEMRVFGHDIDVMIYN